MKKPISYFKFVSFERRQILESGLIRFTPAAEFNDPFELNPTITPLSRKFIEYQSKSENSGLMEPHFSEEDIDIHAKERVCWRLIGRNLTAKWLNTVY